VTFWQKDFGKKRLHKILVKLTPDFIFTNILHAAFSYKSINFIVVLVIFGARKLAQKLLVKC